MLEAAARWEAVGGDKTASHAPNSPQVHTQAAQLHRGALMDARHRGSGTRKTSRGSKVQVQSWKVNSVDKNAISWVYRKGNEGKREQRGERQGGRTGEPPLSEV